MSELAPEHAVSASRAPEIASASAARPKIVYFAHDISHPDVLRKVDMMELGGAQVVLIGFQRLAKLQERPGQVTISLGTTEDGQFLQRIGAVLLGLTRLGRHAEHLRGAQGVLARNLEMLVLGAAARARFSLGAPLSYECIDIHRFQSSSGPIGAALRALEGVLLARCRAIVTSSQRFIPEYFERYHRSIPRTILVENKVWLEEKEPRARSVAIPAGPPWRIGWYGNIRCKRSLEILAEVGRRRPGLVEVIIGDRPTSAVFGDVEATFSGLPGITFTGPFVDKKSAGLYKAIHFTWAMDFYEAGSNSDWLLPNRLYRAVYYGAVPIALASVETGRWLSQLGLGLVVDKADAETIIAAFEAMTPSRFHTLQKALDDVPDPAVAIEPPECRALVAELTGATPPGATKAA